ncbi:MAG: 2-amino-4-hydroxy-6-hydroxymethyldihydropteridine diphosphokinase [Sphingomonas sp.]|jgi:2-amino-4-hydroxy-6-hydroxymethyldihydropteridine diphosphokinase
MSLPSGPQHFVIAIGSNQRGRHGSPAQEVAAALAAVGGVVRASSVLHTAPLGPSRRRYANAAALVATNESPAALLARLKTIEHAFGRRAGQRWGARVIDLDIILWSGGGWAGEKLIIPHISFRERAFVIGPVAAIVPRWRDPLTQRTMRQLAYRALRG